MNPDTTTAAIVVAIILALSIVWFLLRIKNKKVQQSPGWQQSYYVLVTGCDSGIGRLTALRAADYGFNVIAACYTSGGAESLLPNSNSVFRTIVADLSTQPGIQAIVECCKASCSGEGKMLWGLINNAGINNPGLIDWLHPSVYEQVMRVNYHAPVSLIYELLPLLKQTKGSRVINITSVCGLVALPSLAPYAASKHALEAYSDILRRETNMWGMKVTIVEPTEMRTKLALCTGEAFFKGFEEASADRKEPYGEGFAMALSKQMTDNIDSMAGDPDLVADKSVQALILDIPPKRMLVGSLRGKLFNGLMIMLPVWCQDHLLDYAFFVDSGARAAMPSTRIGSKNISL